MIDRAWRCRARVLAGAVLALAPLATPAAAQRLVVRAGTLYPVSSPPIADGVVLIEDGKITAVGSARDVAIPDDVPMVSAVVVTPGLIDAHSVVGLSGYLNQAHDQDQLERSAALQPELRAIDAYNPRERLVEWVRGFGVTTIHTGHGPGAVISGQTLIAKTTGDTIADAVLRPVAMVAATLGEGATQEGGKSPGTRSKAVAMLRELFIEAQAYRAKLEDSDEEGEGDDGGDEDDEGGGKGGGKPPRNLRLEVLSGVLSGELPLLITAHRAADIEAALRIADEFNVRVVLDGAAEAHTMLDEIRAAGVPVLVHPMMVRKFGERENASLELPSMLREAGIPFSFQSGFESYVPKTRVLLFEAGIAAANGLSFDDTLAAITWNAARILGIDDRVGSLEVGKDADLAMFDGDPFEYTTHAVGVVIDGVVVSEVRR